MIRKAIPLLALALAAGCSSKDSELESFIAQTKQEQPGAKMKVVRESERHPFEWFSADDRAFFTATVRRHLRNWFGYDYNDWTVPSHWNTRAA